MINTFWVQDGVSKTLSPDTILDGRHKMYMSQKIINIGSFAYIHFETTNTMKSRSVPAIALRQSNKNDGHIFFESGDQQENA